MPRQSQPEQSHLFLLRLWRDEAGALGRAEGAKSLQRTGSDGEIHWQGKLQHVVSGEVHSFEEWPVLIDYLLEALGDASVTHEGEEP